MSKFKVGDNVRFVGNTSNHVDEDELVIYKNNLVVDSVGEKCITVLPKGECKPIWWCNYDELEKINEPIFINCESIDNYLGILDLYNTKKKEKDMSLKTLIMNLLFL